MAEPQSPPSDHAAHDLLAVAEAADRGATLPTSLTACPDCTALHADLVALAAALPSSATPMRPRDYTLTPADAARLRPGGWRRLVAAIGSSRDVISRPLAIGFTTLGLAGLLVATVPGALPGGSAGAAPESDRTMELQVDASPAPASGDVTGGGSLSQSESGAAPSPKGPTTETGPDPVVVLSSGLLVAGVGLFAVRRAAGRTRDAR